MELFDVVGKIRDRGVDVNNYIKATTQAIDYEATQRDYEAAVFEITGSYIHTEFESQAKQFFVNVVASAVRTNCGDEDLEIDSCEIVEEAKQRTESYFEVFRNQVPPDTVVRWKAATPAELQELIAEHKKAYVRPTSKQDRAIEIVKNNPTLSNKELQQLFRDQLNLTPNGAATYVYNVKKILSATK